jgi:hypothetical protein
MLRGCARTPKDSSIRPASCAGSAASRSSASDKPRLGLLEVIAAASSSLDEAHELAYELSLPATERCCGSCGRPVARLPGFLGWQHAASGFPPSQAAACQPGQRVQVVRRPRMRPAVTGGRIGSAGTGR